MRPQTDPISTGSSARPVEPTGEETWRGDFRRGPAVFTVLEAPGEAGEREFRVYCDDGVGQRLVCHFTPDPEAAPVWRGAWRGDAWCVWIEDQARKIIANPAEGEGH